MTWEKMSGCPMGMGPRHAGPKMLPQRHPDRPMDFYRQLLPVPMAAFSTSQMLGPEMSLASNPGV